MNTVKSFWLGWGSLCVAGGGAYYFAKKQINAERMAKLEEHRRSKQTINTMQYSDDSSQAAASSGMGGGNRVPAQSNAGGSPSHEVGIDPAPTQHPPPTDQGEEGKSKYESKVPYRSAKGDRFS